MSKFLRQKFINWIGLMLPVWLGLACIGYFVPWVAHRAAGLAITGIDFGEYVKFLPAVQAGTVPMWREAFYLPLVAISISASLAANRREFAFPLWLRIFLLLIASAAVGNLLPPAWTPQRLLLPEFRLQVVGILTGLLMVALSPVAGRIPAVIFLGANLGLCAAALIFPLRQFWFLLPLIQELYQQPVTLGTGPYLLSVALLGLGITPLLLLPLTIIPSWVGGTRTSTQSATTGSSSMLATAKIVSVARTIQTVCQIG